MSADDLDDFFAKKDKKKKARTKYTPVELLQQQTSGDTTAAVASDGKKKKKKDKSKDTSDVGESKSYSGLFTERDEDWIAFEEEKEKDYSGLKISMLQISKDTDEEVEVEAEYEEDEDGNVERKPREESGPWKAVSTPSSTTAQHQPSPQPRPATPELDSTQLSSEPETPSPHGKYVPPSVRRAATAAASQPSSLPRTNRFKKKEAPDVQNEMEFPSLGATTTAGDRQLERELERQDGGAKFETVRGGGTNRDIDSSSGSQRLELGNKFSALQR